MTRPFKIVLAALGLFALAACSNAPQQPSDVVDDLGSGRVADGPTQPPSPDFRDITTLGTDAARTGTTAEPATITPLVGTWVGQNESCDTATALVTITPKRFESAERSCDISDVIDGGEGNMTIGLRCTALDGSIDSQLVKFSPTGSGLDMNVIASDSGAQSLVRCP